MNLFSLMLMVVDPRPSASKLEEDLRGCLKETEAWDKLRVWVPQQVAEPALEPELSESIPSALATRPLPLFQLGSPNQALAKERGCENMKPWAYATCRRQVNGAP